MKEFNTSGPNIPIQHYTIERTKQLKQGIKLIEKDRYFTIWAPRQTGKSTFFRQLAKELKKQDYKVAHINFENYKNASLNTFIYTLTDELNKNLNIDLRQEKELAKIFKHITEIKNKKCVLIIDEVEGINKEYFSDFLHSIRNAYHSRENHCLKSVILVGVSNIVGIVQDSASPFNIADNLNVPYFTENEVYELLQQHETETGQLFDKKVKEKIYQITSGQPGLVNGFAKVLVDKNIDKKILDYNAYLKVEDWYLTEAIDKNFANILNQARKERRFVERLLFTEDEIPFEIDRESIKLLYTNGLIKKDKNGNVKFWVPFYKKRLYKAFYPYTNGERKEISRTIFAEEYFDTNNNFKIEKLISAYKEYVKRRSFKAFLEKDENGNYKSLKESALIYSFETFISAVIAELKGKIYREADTGLGKSDMIINLKGQEYLIETKVYYSQSKFEDGKKQLAYYCKSSGLNTGIYLVFKPTNQKYPKNVKEQTEKMNDINIKTYLIDYDDTKW